MKFDDLCNSILNEEQQSDQSQAEFLLKELFNSFEFLTTEKYPNYPSIWNVAKGTAEVIRYSDRDEDGMYSYEIAFNLPFEVVPRDTAEEDVVDSYNEMFQDVLSSYGGPGRAFSRGGLADVQDLGNGIGRFNVYVSGGMDI